MKSLYVTGYRPQELGIFSNNHAGIPIIKKALENQFRTLIDEGLEWIIVSGQQGVESWATEVVLTLKEEFSHLKYSVITPFLEQEKNWNEAKQMAYAQMISQADFVTSVTNLPYEAPWQFVEKDKFIIENTDGALVIYDEENEGSPQYVLRLIEKYAQQHDYELFKINAYDLQMVAEEMQQAQWEY